MGSGATGWLKNICYCEQGVIIFIVQNKLVLYFCSTYRQYNTRRSRALTTKRCCNGATIGMPEGQLIVALIISVSYILMNVMLT